MPKARRGVCNMLKLPDVTLTLIETREHKLAALALEDCERKAEFGDVVVFTDKPELFKRNGRRIVEVPDWPTKLGWSKCFWYDVPQHIHTSHTLGIQWDSWIVDPSMWRDEYLDKDYIGAPWPFHGDGLRVGNGGFCLRSTRMLHFIRKYRSQLPCTNDFDDNLYCRKYRPSLENAGFIWADEATAYNFAFEWGKPEPGSRHFGFHACFNFDYGCEGDEQRLLERAEIMSRSDYIKRGQFWQSFTTKYPGVVEKLQNIEENRNG
jgi:hypothetical protein